MRIALCFSGLPRNIKDTYRSISKNLIKPNGIKDIFIHVWECENGDDIGNKWRHYIYDKSDREYMLEKYAPRRCFEETQESFRNGPEYIPDAILDKYPTDKKATTRSDKQSQFYSLYQSVKLVSDYQKEHGFVYDMIIRLRFDLVFFTPIIVADLNPSELHVSYFMTNTETGLMVNDWLSIGSYDNTQKYAEIWNNFIPILEQGTKLHPEEMMATNLKNYNIKINPSIGEANHTLYKYFKPEPA